jgi:hypothetical protein
MNKEYLDFINECRNKNYENLTTQMHHIIPKHMNGSDSIDNLIELSLEDHYTAHILLSECYDGKYKRQNLSSAIMIKGYLDNIENLNEYQKSLSGEGNPNYGNKWSVLKKQMASKRVKEYWSIPSNKEKIKKPKSDSSKMGRHDKFGEKNPFYGKTHTDETKAKISEKRVGKYNGEQNIPIIIDNIEYRSAGEASKILNIPMVTIRWRVRSKNKKFENYKYKK